MPDFEYTIIGAGVVGLAVAAEISGKSRHVVVLEKNDKYGMETSSRNSEVIHAGIYYPPGSLKAVLCIEGRDLLYSICEQNHISHDRCSKLITASNQEELPKLEEIFRRGRENGARLRMLSAQAASELEPNIRTVGAIYSPDTGILSAHELMDYFYHVAIERNATVQPRCEVTGIQKRAGEYEITIREGELESSFTSEKLINAAGLHSDAVAALAGIDIDQAGYRLSFAKGSYFAVRPSKANLVSRLVYPVPQNEGLGVHALRDWGGRLKFGPDVEYLEQGVIDYSVDETKASAFAESIRRILPQITADDLMPDMSGIRPKLQKKGEPPKDFVIRHERDRGLEGFVNLIGIDSPGLTASPAIARHVAGLLE
ncbi:MAG: NAD(P)/FAD-dependent oxidoreductase [Ignavibacteriales bacterium]|nr:NAD(P)/FAD-dependent oxidoreductase [Ignavibacteriales bacterium]